MKARRLMLAGMVVFGSLAVLDFTTFALAAGGGGRGPRYDEPTGSTLVDFLIEISPAINVIIAAFLTMMVQRQRREQKQVLELVGADPDDSEADAYDADGQGWVRVRPRPELGKRQYDRPPRGRDKRR